MVQLRLPPHTSCLDLIPDTVRQWAESQELADWPLTLVATELAANAIAVTPPDQLFEIAVCAVDTSVEVTVSDPGPGFDHVDYYPLVLEEVAPPPPTQPRGRGLPIVRQLAERVSIDRDTDHTIVTAEVALSQLRP